ncbi:MAG: QueT transporter family protein [Clostridia bacterium]|nr:QueT transporter family protein [Clostridia bacterium]
MHRRTLYLCRAALIAALYVALTWVSSMLGLSSGVIQIRFSEMLCILPVFTSAAIPGLTLGCLCANLFTGAIWQDIVFGTLATLLGAIGTYSLKSFKWLAPIPPVAANSVIVPLVLAYGYKFEGGLPYFMLTVFIGEIISVYLLGLLLRTALSKRKNFFSEI